MGAPIFIINHSKRQFIKYHSSAICNPEIFLPKYVNLFLNQQWHETDKIEIDNICDDERLDLIDNYERVFLNFGDQKYMLF
jgi:hypothetical protein